MKQLTNLEVREAQLLILDIFAKECQNFGLTFFLYYGTLLGAIRGKKFIPWDDDIDLVMPRKCFNRLGDIGWSKYDCDLITARRCPSSPYLPTKLSLKSTAIVDYIDDFDENVGINIDIFPIDYLPSKKIEYFIFTTSLYVFKILHTLKVTKVSGKRTFWKNAILRIFKIPMRRLSANKISLIINKLVEKKCIGDRAGSLLGPYGMREILNAEYLEGSVQVEFEGRLLPAPAGFDNILTSIYGDYMKLPAIEKRLPHHSFEAFERRNSC